VEADAFTLTFLLDGPLEAKHGCSPFFGQILASNVPGKMWKKTLINQSSNSIVGGFAVEKIHQKQGPL
jgi:hypothetical protein